MLISHKRKFVFLAMPKTASTSVRKILEKHSDIIGVKAFETTEEFPFNEHLPARELKKIFDERGWDWFDYRRFCLVRNPYDRIVSEYHYRYVANREELLKRRSPIRRTLLKIKDRVKRTTFREFVLSLPSNKERKAATSPISDFVCDYDGQCLVDDILMYEKLNEQVPVYLKELGIDVSPQDIPYLNTSDRGSYREYYNKETKQVIDELFAYDIEQFGYQF